MLSAPKITYAYARKTKTRSSIRDASRSMSPRPMLLKAKTIITSSTCTASPDEAGFAAPGDPADQSAAERPGRQPVVPGL